MVSREETKLELFGIAKNLSLARKRRGDLSRDARVAVGVHRVDAARAAEEMAREQQRAHVRQMRWAREHGRGEPVRCFDAEEYDEGDDAFDALFDERLYTYRRRCGASRTRQTGGADGTWQWCTRC